MAHSSRCVGTKAPVYLLCVGYVGFQTFPLCSAGCRKHLCPRTLASRCFPYTVILKSACLKGRERVFSRQGDPTRMLLQDLVLACESAEEVSLRECKSAPCF